MTSRHPHLSRRTLFATGLAATGIVAAPTPRLAPLAPGTVQISVDASRWIWRVPRGLRGFNFWGTRSDPPFFPEYRKIGLDLLRFPPGRTGDENELDDYLIDESAKVARGLNADLAVEVRLQRGTAERAAGRVEYTNIRRRYGARYWEVGNEPDLYVTRVGDPEYSPAWYSTEFRTFAQAMKRADPTITVFGPVLSNELVDWMPSFINACGDVIDGLSWHFYPGNDELSEPDLLASTARFDQQVAYVRNLWSSSATNPKGFRRNVPLLISEYGASYLTSSARNLATQAAAVWTADMLGRLMVNRIDLAAYFTLWGIGYHGVWDPSTEPRPVYYTFRLFNEFGEYLLETGSSEPTVAAYSSLRRDGTLTLMLLNKSVDTSHQVSIALNQFEAGGPVQAFRHDEQTPALPVPIGTPTDPLALILPPLSTTLLVVPPRLSRSLALVGGAAALILAGLAVARRRPERA